MRYICFVCGFDGLNEQFYIDDQFSSTFEICPCCGFQYGYHDLNGSDEYPENFKERDIIIAYRKEWIQNGMKWWSEEDGEPDERKHLNWNPHEQLKNIPPEFLDGDEKY